MRKRRSACITATRSLTDSGPRSGEIFTRERESAGEINWGNAFGNNFSCLVGNIWLARKKKKAAWISHEECGCMGRGLLFWHVRPLS